MVQSALAVCVGHADLMVLSDGPRIMKLQKRKITKGRVSSSGARECVYVQSDDSGVGVLRYCSQTHCCCHQMVYGLQNVCWSWWALAPAFAVGPLDAPMRSARPSEFDQALASGRRRRQDGAGRAPRSKSDDGPQCPDAEEKSGFCYACAYNQTGGFTRATPPTIEKRKLGLGASDRTLQKFAWTLRVLAS